MIDDESPHPVGRPEPWTFGEPGVLALPGGRVVRGRRVKATPARPATWSLILTLQDRTTPHPHRWVCWPDFALPLSSSDAWDAIEEAYARSATERIEVACGGGRGRTGTALAALAMLDGLSADDAIAWVRVGYDRRAVETPWQRGWLRRRR